MVVSLFGILTRIDLIESFGLSRFYAEIVKRIEQAFFVKSSMDFGAATWYNVMCFFA